MAAQEKIVSAVDRSHPSRFSHMAFQYESPPAERTLWGVGALIRALADALDARFNPVRVRGELSGFTRAASGHSYFSLKDEQGQLRCAMFRRAAQAVTVDLRDGMTVEVQGRLDIYGPRGDLQLIVESLRPAGQGSLYEQFLRLKAQLEAEGCFLQTRKRSLPPFPASIGVVTSLDAAALRDVATTLQRRVPHLPVRVFASPVQGDAAPDALRVALQRAYEHHRRTGECEVLLLVRGGGSLEDLWAFNTPQVVRTVVEAPMPVVCGVGHETDFTLADFAADLRAPTPTAAAELCAPAQAALLLQLEQWQGRLDQSVRRHLDQQAIRLDRAAQRLGRPSQLLTRESTRLQGLAHRLQRGLQAKLTQVDLKLDRQSSALAQALERDVRRRQQRLGVLSARLQGLDPHLVLQRGYALLTDPAGHAVASVGAAKVGQPLHARLSDGLLDLTVTATRT